MFSETSEIELVVDDDCNHPRPAIISGSRDTKDHRFLHFRPRTDCVRDFTRRDVLALPAKRVPHAIDKVEESCRIATHQIAAPEPRVTRRENVAQHLAIGGCTVGIAMELCLQGGSVARDLA